MAHSRPGRRKVLFVAFLAIAIPFIANEWFGEKFRESKILQPLKPAFWYRKFGPGAATQSRVDEFRIVAFSAEDTPQSALGENRCTHRAFLAKLLRRIAEDPAVNPRLVVIDKWYNRIPDGVCGTQPNPTEELRDALNELSKKVIVVIAVESFNSSEVRQLCHGVLPENVQEEEMVLADFQRFDLAADKDHARPESTKTKNMEAQCPAISGGQIRFGLARIDADIRKVPLGWQVYCNCDQVATGQSTPWPTLSVAVAGALDPMIFKLQGLVASQAVSHPYIKILPEETSVSGQPEKTFTAVSAQKVLEGNPDALQQINQRIVIIGEPWRDIHKTDVGIIDGPSLQANYIAALLSESTLKPVSRLVNGGISLAWLAVIFSVFYCWKRLAPWPELGVAVTLALTIAFAIIFSLVITAQFRIFVDVSAPTILEIIGLYLARRIEIMIEPHG